MLQALSTGWRRALEVVGAPELGGKHLPAFEAGEEGRIGRIGGLREAQGRAADGAEDGDEEAGCEGEIARDAMRRRSGSFRQISLQVQGSRTGDRREVIRTAGPKRD